MMLMLRGMDGWMDGRKYVFGSATPQDLSQNGYAIVVHIMCSLCDDGNDCLTDYVWLDGRSMIIEKSPL